MAPEGSKKRKRTGGESEKKGKKKSRRTREEPADVPEPALDTEDFISLNVPKDALKAFQNPDKPQLRKPKAQRPKKEKQKPRKPKSENGNASAPKVEASRESSIEEDAIHAPTETSFNGDGDLPQENAVVDNAGKTKKSKKRRNKGNAADESGDGKQGEGKNARFIVFIGNLPYTATQPALQKHFKAVLPNSIRLITDKATKKPKGFAFLEFDHYDRMKACLKSYHHSDFDDGISPARKINVELTAGGGGSKSKDRKQKILIKNGKLDDERRRRIRAEYKKKQEAEGGGDANSNANIVGVKEGEKANQHEGLHPDRLKRLK